MFLTGVTKTHVLLLLGFWGVGHYEAKYLIVDKIYDGVSNASVPGIALRLYLPKGFFFDGKIGI